MLNQISIFSWVILFFLYLLFDTLYVLYIQSVTDVKPVRAANIGAIMYLLTAYGTIEFIDNFVNLIPILAGGWLGSYLTLKLGKRKGEKDIAV